MQRLSEEGGDDRQRLLLDNVQNRRQRQPKRYKPAHRTVVKPESGSRKCIQPGLFPSNSLNRLILQCHRSGLKVGIHYLQLLLLGPDSKGSGTGKWISEVASNHARKQLLRAIE
jgi:hypothetical protein